MATVQGQLQWSSRLVVSDGRVRSRLRCRPDFGYVSLRVCEGLGRSNKELAAEPGHGQGMNEWVRQACLWSKGKSKKGSLVMLHLPAALPCLIAAQRRKRKENDCQRSVDCRRELRRGSAGVETSQWFRVGEPQAEFGVALAQSLGPWPGRVLLPAVVLSARSFQSKPGLGQSFAQQSFQDRRIANANLLIPAVAIAAKRTYDASFGSGTVTLGHLESDPGLLLDVEMSPDRRR
ncbi:hypothetical protein HDV63DRAFT_140602 [Trichoderma sp. SZMC 28014]